MRHGELGLQGDGLVIGTDRRVEVAPPAQHVAQVIVGVDVAGAGLDGAAEGRLGVFHAALVFQGQAKVHVTVGIVGLELDGAPAGRFRLGAAPQPVERHGQVVVA